MEREEELPTTPPTPTTKKQKINEELSICIPRLPMNTTKREIFESLKKMRIGLIDNIDLVIKVSKQNEKYKRAFIEIKKMFNTENGKRSYELLKAGKEIKIVYNEPWFWKASISKTKIIEKKKKEANEQPNEQPKLNTEEP